MFNKYKILGNFNCDKSEFKKNETLNTYYAIKTNKKEKINFRSFIQSNNL